MDVDTELLHSKVNDQRPDQFAADQQCSMLSRKGTKTILMQYTGQFRKTHD